MRLITRFGARVRDLVPRRVWTGNVILMSHRVARSSVDPWALCVSPENFAGQLRFFSCSVRVCPLSDVIEAPDGAESAVAITFDDGYVDNLQQAAPVLARFGQPATIFVSSGSVDNGRTFWWDELASIFLQPGRLRKTTLTLAVNGVRFRWNIRAEDQEYSQEQAARHRAWLAWTAPPTSRHRVFHAIWATLQGMPASEREVHLDAIRQWAEWEPDRQDAPRCMNATELLELSRRPGISIGSHTVTHPRLADLSPSEQDTEIAGSKCSLEQLLRRPVPTFAYPYGGKSDYGPKAVRAVERAGYTLACANFEGTVSRTSDRLQLPRFHAPNLSGPEFQRWWRSRFRH